MGLTIEEFDIQMAISKAVHDHKYPADKKGEYPDGPQKDAYDRQTATMCYEQGRSDCKDGIPQRRDNDDYLRGYAAQHEQEQRDTARTLGEGE